MNNQQQTKKPFDRAQFEADLDAFGTLLRERTWSFEATNYADYCVALREESELHRQAEKLGKYGVDEFRLIQEHKAAGKFRAEADREAEKRISYVEEREKKLNEEIKALKLRFYQPVDWFKERDLVSHDWYYDYSDSGSTYRAGKASEKRLIEKAKEGGKDFQEALVAKWNEIYKRTDVTWTTLEAKLKSY
jgi:hypothetical protein